MQESDKPQSVQETKPADMPETMVINGVTYRRELDSTDKLVNMIERYKVVADRTGVSLRQAVWFNTGDSTQPMPD